MTKVFAQNEWYRRSFTKQDPEKMLEAPSLTNLQVSSYEEFLQKDIAPARRKDKGLQAVFKSIFPIYDFNNTVSLEFVQYALEKPKYSEKECRQRGLSYEAPLKITVRLVFYDTESAEEGEDLNISSIKEQEVYLGNIPLMTPTGSFIFNGTQRVIVSQLHRSPGIVFEHDGGKKHSSGKVLYSARIIPARGSWLDFEFDHKNILYARIDRKRKLHATVVLKAMGYSDEELLDIFYKKETLHLKEDSFKREVDFNLMIGSRASDDIADSKGKVIVRKGKKITKLSVKKLAEAKITKISATLEDITGKISAADIYDETTGEVILDNVNYGDQVRSTLLLDKVNTKEEALAKIFERLRPGEPATVEAAEELFNSLFFDENRYDLSHVGRMKVNYKFGLDIPVEQTVLTKDDIIRTASYLVDLNNGRGQIDDIDHLGNR